MQFFLPGVALVSSFFGPVVVVAVDSPTLSTIPFVDFDSPVVVDVDSPVTMSLVKKMV